jgi:hypothetical protein
MAGNFTFILPFSEFWFVVAASERKSLTRLLSELSEVKPPPPAAKCQAVRNYPCNASVTAGKWAISFSFFLLRMYV